LKPGATAETEQEPGSMATVIMLYHISVDSLQTLLDAGLYIGHHFEFHGKHLTVTFIGKLLPGAQTVSLGLTVGDGAEPTSA